MSLNRIEQMVFDYVQAHPEEKKFWEDKVRSTAIVVMDEHAAATDLERELWSYFEERSRVASPFRDAAAEGLRRTSLRNLAELWLRLWVPPRSKRRPSPPENFL